MSSGPPPKPPGFSDPDAAYRLIALAHRGLSADESAALNARLVLILASHAGDMAVLREAIALAKSATDPTDAPH
jgi:Protein of unknown function (DUF2783)